MSKTATVKLEYPIDNNGQTITELTLRRPNVGDMVTAEKVAGKNAGEIEFNGILCACCADIPWPAFRQIDVADSDRIAAAVKELSGNVAAPVGANSQS